MNRGGQREGSSPNSQVVDELTLSVISLSGSLDSTIFMIETFPLSTAR